MTNPTDASKDQYIYRLPIWVLFTPASENTMKQGTIAEALALQLELDEAFRTHVGAAGGDTATRILTSEVSMVRYEKTMYVGIVLLVEVDQWVYITRSLGTPVV